MVERASGLAPGRAGEEFLAEAQELVAAAGEELSALEELLRRGERDPARVHALFRHVHTLKGVAATFGVGDLARLAHALEDALDRLRLDRDTLDEGALARLSRAVAHMDDLLDRLRAGVPDDGARTERVVRELREPDATAGAPPGPTPLDPALAGVLTEYEEHRLRKALGEGAAAWRVRTSAPLDALDRALDALRAAAAPYGEVITFMPGALEPGGASLELDALLVSHTDEAALRAALEGDGRRLEPARAAAPPPSAPPPALGALAVAGGAPRAMRSVRVDIRRLDELMSLLGEFSLMRASLGRAVERSRTGDGRSLHAELARLQREFGRGVEALQRALLEARMVPLGQVFERATSEARKLARRLSRSLRVVVTGADTAVDKLIVEELAAPLLHVVRNAVDHGVEDPATRHARGKPPEATLAINAWQAGSRVVVEVEDDGAGIDPAAVTARAVALGLVTEVAARSLDRRAAMELLFRPGFTTRDEATDTSGRGVGLDVVRAALARLGGVVELASEPGVFTKVTVTLPITLAILPSLLVGVAGRRYALPMSAVSEAVRLGAGDARRVGGREVFTHRGRTLPLCRLGALFYGEGFGEPSEERGAAATDGAPIHAAGGLYAVVIALGGQRAALAVDELVGQQDVVIKPLGRSLGHVRWFAGAADLGEQRAGLVLDVVALLDEALGRSRGGAP